MTERTVSVSLVAKVSGYISEMQRAQNATAKSTVTATQKLADQKAAMTEVGRAAVAMGAVLAAGVAVAIKKFADFDAQMSLVKTLSHATADEMDGLTEAALHAGQKIGFSATEVAEAETELVKAGISVKDILGGALPGALNLAAAGQIDVGKATEIAAEAMTQFKLKGKDVPHIADLLAAGADKALGSVDDLGTALQSGGLVASQFGLNINETVGTLSAFAQAGLMGERAGTTLRQMLLKLGNPSKEAAALMDKYNISLYDAQGNFVGMSDLAGQLKDKLGKLDNATRNAALSTIFGTRAIQGAAVLYSDGAKGIQDWTDAVNDAGFAQEQARGKMDNLEGDLKKLGAAFDTSLIEAGSSANDVLRDMTQNLTSLVGFIGTVPGPVLGAGLAVASLLSGILLLGGGALLVIPKIAAFKLALDTLNLKGKNLAKTLGKGGAVLLAIGVFINALAHANDQTQLTTTQLAKFDAAFKIGGVKEFTKQLNKAGLFTGDLKTKLDTATVSGFGGFMLDLAHKTGNMANTVTGGLIPALDDGVKALGSSAAAFKEYGLHLSDVAKSDLPLATSSFAELANSMGGGSEVIAKLLKAMPDYEAALITLAGDQGKSLTKQELYNLAMGKGETATKIASAAAEENADATKTQADKFQEAADKAAGLKDQLVGLIDALNKANGEGQDAISTNAAYQATLADVDEAIKNAKAGVDGYSLGLDSNTEAGANNQKMLAGLANDSQTAAKAQFDLTGDTGAYEAALRKGRATVIQRAEDLGATKAEAIKLADKIYAIPTKKEFNMIANTKHAQDEIDGFIRRNNGRSLRVYVDSIGRTTYRIPGTNIGLYADGGTVRGPGTSKSDSVLIAASTGEEITPEPQATKYRGLLKSIAADDVPGYKAGGTVYRPAVQYVPSGPSGYSPAAAAASTASDRPIYMDGALFGMLQEVANGEARIVLNKALRTRYLRAGN